MLGKKFGVACGLLTIALWTTATSAFSQDQKLVDSLAQNLSVAQEDSNKVKTFLNLARLYYQTNPDSFFLCTHQALDLARKIEWPKGIANSTNNIGLLLSDTGNHQLAITYLEESLRINREISAKLNIINNLTNLGRIYYRQGDFVKSSDYFFDALEIAEAINNHEKIAMIGTNLTATFCSEKDWVKGEKYARLTLHHSELANAPIHSFKSYIALGEIRAEQFDTLGAKSFFESALEVCQKNDFKLLSAEALSNLARIESNYDNALATILKARKILDELSPNSLNSVMNLEALGVLYLNLYQSRSSAAQRKVFLQKAEYYLQEKVRKCTELNYIEALALGLNQLVKVQELKGDFKLAHQYSKQYHAINDSLYSQESKNKIATIEGQREVALRDKEIELNKLALSTQRKQNIALTLGLGLVVIIGALLYRQNQIRKKTNAELVHLNSQLDEANKVKAKFFAILSHDLRSPLARLINFLHLQKEAPDLLTGQQATIHQQKIVTSAEALLENMETVLLWGKGQMVDFKPVKKKILISSLFKQLDDTFKDYERVHLSFSDSENIEITTDENYLFTIMQNLTANAMKALDGTTDGSIRWKAEKQNDSKITLSITDNGPGLNEDQRDKLLNSQEITANKNGFGFHIIRDLAKAIECTIEVESKLDSGTTFRLHC